MGSSVAAGSVWGVYATKMDEGPGSTGPLLLVVVTVEPLLLGGSIDGSLNVRVGKVATAGVALAELHGAFDLDAAHWGSLGDVPLGGAVVASVDVLDTSPEVAKGVVAAVGGCELTDFSEGGVTTKTVNRSVVADIDFAVVETGLEEESVSAVGPLALVAVASELTEDGVSE